MPIKVKITPTKDAEITRICDRYNNNNELYPGTGHASNVRPWETITLDQVTTNGSSPPMGKLQVTGKVKNEAGKWEDRDERFTVAAGAHEWPARGMVSLVEMVMERRAPADSGDTGAGAKAN